MLPDFRVRQRDYLLEISRALTQELNLDKLLARILNIAVEMLAGQAGLIALRKEHEGWTVSASYGIPASFLRYLVHALAEVSDHEDPARFELPEINRLLQNMTRSASMGLLTGVGLPLIAQKKVIGVIFIFRNYLGVFSSNDTALLQSFADQAAIAVNNAQLYTQVTHEKKRLDALLDSAADGILILAPNHVIERCTPAFARMLGKPLEEIRGKKHEEVIRWVSVKDGLTLEQSEAGGWPLTPNATLYVEGDLQRSNGMPLPVGITYAPVHNPDRTLMNIIATVRDITRYREADELKSTFVSVISHELKTPVALIKGYVSTLRREDATWDRLGQVLSNLLSNAIKYSPQGGAIRISGQVFSNQVVICVSDQGPGIAANDIPHVFDRFYRAGEASRNTKGAGLGLYLARAVVEAHGGRIWVDPKPGEGARICFSLPRS